MTQTILTTSIFLKNCMYYKKCSEKIILYLIAPNKGKAKYMPMICDMLLLLGQVYFVKCILHL